MPSTSGGRPPVPPDNASLKATAETLAAIQTLTEKQLEVVARQEHTNAVSADALAIIKTLAGKQLEVVERQEQANDKAAKLSMWLTSVSLGIATVSFMVTALASWADWKGDAKWQSEQVEELRAVNEQLEKMLELQAEDRAEQQRNIEDLLKAITVQNSEGRNVEPAAGQSSNAELPKAVENQ